MDCETFHLELPDLIYGELDPSRKTAGDAHLAGCSTCTELLSDLQTVRTAAPVYTPSPLLNSRIKLAARDALLGGEHEPPPPITGRGGPLHTMTTLVLAGCVCLAGFALGIYYERTQQPAADQANDPTPSVPDATPDLVTQEQEPWLVEINDPNPGSKPGRVSLDSEEWQRVLFEVGAAHLERGEYGEAREVFSRASTTAPEGPLAAAAQVGVAEALLREGAPNAAKTKLEEIRLAIIAGRLYGNELLLQRIHTLIEEAASR